LLPESKRPEEKREVEDGILGYDQRKEVLS
jgi:hypothetical protein